MYYEHDMSMAPRPLIQSITHKEVEDWSSIYLMCLRTGVGFLGGHGLPGGVPNSS